MADKLSKYYEDANAMGGIKAKMRLSVLTGIPSSKAASEADSPENIEKFEKAMAELKKEYS
jgi:hypothetical protein